MLQFHASQTRTKWVDKRMFKTVHVDQALTNFYFCFSSLPFTSTNCRTLWKCPCCGLNHLYGAVPSHIRRRRRSSSVERVRWMRSPRGERKTYNIWFRRRHLLPESNGRQNRFRWSQTVVTDGVGGCSWTKRHPRDTTDDDASRIGMRIESTKKTSDTVNNGEDGIIVQGCFSGAGVAFNTGSLILSSLSSTRRLQYQA